MSKILVTKPFQAPFEEVVEQLKQVWDAEWLTNNGPLLRQLEHDLGAYLGTENLAVVGNGTLAIQVALRALEVSGEVITTPFSYVATTSSIVYEGFTPVFVDIDPNTFTIDPKAIEASITEKTTAILATHIFGIPCDVEAIEALAKKHDLKVIYDAAHCFGSTYKGRSVLSYGDISTLSMHATKLFHSVEGGAIVVNDNDQEKVDSVHGWVTPLRYKVDRLRNFGHNGPEEFDGVGINAKNSEFHAAVGLVNLRYADRIMANRAHQHEVYNEALKSVELIRPGVDPQVGWNHSYYPVVFESEEETMAVLNGLAENEIYARRYFYPVLNSLEYIKDKGQTPVAQSISTRILCLPLYWGLTDEEIQRVAAHIVRICENFRG